MLIKKKHLQSLLEKQSQPTDEKSPLAPSEESKQQVLQEMKAKMEAEHKKYIRKWERLIQQAAQELSALSSERQQLLETSKPVLLELAVKTAEQILHKEVSRNPEDILYRCLEAAFESIGSLGDGKLHLVVHPDDEDRAQNFVDELKKQAPTPLDLQVRPNPEVHPGSCRLKGEAGTLDLDFNAQLEILKDKMERELQSEGEGEESSTSDQPTSTETQKAAPKPETKDKKKNQATASDPETAA